MTEFRKMRRFKQELSRCECDEVLSSEKRGVLCVNGEDGYPYGVPINYVYDEDSGRIYFHCAKEGHKLDGIRASSKVCFTVYEQGEQRGDWSYYVRSVVVFGRVRIIDDLFESISHLRTLAEKYYPQDGSEDIEGDIAANSPRAVVLELEPENVTGKLVHEK